jgi:hypothetical protein
MSESEFVQRVGTAKVKHDQLDPKSLQGVCLDAGVDLGSAWWRCTALSLTVLLVVLGCGCFSGSSHPIQRGKIDPNTVIDVTGSIGGVKPSQTRSLTHS